jgi:hypothetical protein
MFHVDDHSFFSARARPNTAIRGGQTDGLFENENPSPSSLFFLHPRPPQLVSNIWLLFLRQYFLCSIICRSKRKNCESASPIKIISPSCQDCNNRQNQFIEATTKNSRITIMTLSIETPSILYALLLPSVSCWVIPNKQLFRAMIPVTTQLASGPFFEEEFEFECPEEDSCEIDWDKMPTEENVQAAPNLDDDCEDEDECEIDWDSMPGFDNDDAEELEEQIAEVSQADVEELEKQIAKVSQAEESIKGRVRLEMNWQIEECETEKDSCEGFCPECAGSGKLPCRFCRGTGFVVFGNEYKPCQICTDGFEECSECRGTGKIAPWTKTYLEGNN